MEFKKKIFALVITLIAIAPVTCYALEFQNVPPNVIVEGLDVSNYEINKLIDGDQVVVSIKEKNTDVSYSWSFDRETVGENLKFNFKLSFTSQKAEEIEQKSIENKDKLFLSFYHHGTLPSRATIKINVEDHYQDGEKLYLYYYDEEKKEIQYVDHKLEVKDGYVEFKIDHCSEYFLTGTIVNDAANNPKSMNIIIIVLIGVIVILVGATMFSTKK